MVQDASFYNQNPKFYVAVDNVIFGFADGKLQVLLQQRDFEPFSGELSVQGGFVQENEDVDTAAERVLFERTGVHDVYITQVGTFGRLDRDPGARVVSVAYYCLLDKARCDDEKVKKYHGVWVDVDSLPELHFDHTEIVRTALFHLRMFIGRKPIGFYLLPENFTLSQLQMLHEAILGVTLDKRNFRKRVADMTFIEKTGLVDKIHSKRGAALYRYNAEEFKNFNKFKL